MSDHLMTAAVLCKYAGVTYRQVDYWTTRGYVKTADIEGIPQRGTGHVRVYTEAEARVARFMGLIAGTSNRNQITPITAGLARDLAINGTATLGPLTLTVVEEQA